MIYINGRFLTSPLTGINRFSYEMCKSLQDIGVEFILLSPSKGILSEYKHDFRIEKIGQFSSHLWEQICVPLFLEKTNNPLFISFSGLGPIFYKNHIATIHDLSFFRNPQWFSWYYAFFYKKMTPLVAKNALHLLTVSEFSKTEIVDILKIEPAKISILYNALSSIFKVNQSLIVNKKEKYFLAVASLDPRKNLERLVKAFEKLSLPDYKLLVVGGNNKVFGKIGVLESSTVKCLGRVSDEELVLYYKKAALFVYPSLYEGFGIPPLEAMSLGCPVLVSDITVCKEVCEDAVYYCNPYNVDDISNKMIASINNFEETKKNVLKGFKQVNKFSWLNSAKGLARLIESFTN